MTKATISMSGNARGLNNILTGQGHSDLWGVLAHAQGKPYVIERKKTCRKCQCSRRETKQFSLVWSGPCTDTPDNGPYFVIDCPSYFHGTTKFSVCIWGPLYLYILDVCYLPEPALLPVRFVLSIDDGSGAINCSISSYLTAILPAPSQ